MNLYVNILVLCLTCILLNGCGMTLNQRESKIVSEGVYASKAGIEKGRVDLAYYYIIKVAEIIPAPKNKIVINSIKAKSIKDQKEQEFVTLPPHLKNREIIILETKDWEGLLKTNTNLKKQLEKEDKLKKSFDQQIQDFKVEQRKEIERLKSEKNKTVAWGWLGWFTATLGWLIPLGGIGLIVACVLNPAIVPVVLNIFGAFYEIVSRIVWAVVHWIQLIIRYIQRFNNDE